MALSKELKEAALIGLRYRRHQIAEQILELERELRGAGRDGGSSATPARRRNRVLSAVTRQRIADAQRQRWAAVRARQQAPGAKRPAKKRSHRKRRTAGKTAAAGAGDRLRQGATGETVATSL